MIGRPTNPRELPGVLLFDSRLESIENDLGLMQQDPRVTDPMRRLFPYHFLSFPIYTVSLVVSPAWKTTYDFQASSPRLIRIISANVLVVVPVCLHSYDDWLFTSSFLYVFPCSSGQHFLHCKLNHLNLG